MNTVARKGHYNLFFFLKLSRDNSNLSRNKMNSYRAIISQFIAVVMNKTDKIREGQIQIDDKHDYRPLSELRWSVRDITIFFFFA